MVNNEMSPEIKRLLVFITWRLSFKTPSFFPPPLRYTELSFLFFFFLVEKLRTAERFIKPKDEDL